MKFVEDADGTVIDGHRASDIRAHARAVFTQLARDPHGPPAHWTDSSSKAQQYYHHEMCLIFPELRFCDLNWKSDKIAIDCYPSWHAHFLTLQQSQVKQEDQATSTV